MAIFSPTVSSLLIGHFSFARDEPVIEISIDLPVLILLFGSNMFKNIDKLDNKDYYTT